MGVGKGQERTGEHEHVQVVGGDLGLASEVEEEAEWVDEDGPADEDGEEGAEDEGGGELVRLRGEQRDADVREDERLRQEVHHFEELQNRPFQIMRLGAL